MFFLGIMPNARINTNILGERLKEAREKAALEQAELSAILSVDYGIELERSIISRIERNKRPVRDIELDAIAKALDVTPNWLLGWDN